MTDHLLDYHVHVVCQNEAQRIGGCLESIAACIGTARALVTLTLNGTSDESEAVAVAAARSVRLPLEIYGIRAADKANALNRFIHEHPGFSRADPSDPWPTPTLLSDHLSQRQFRRLGLYREHFRLYGIHYQLGASFAVSPTRRISFGLNRASRNFTEEHRLMIGLLRQHLAAAWRRGRAEEEIAAAVSARDAALVGVGAAVVVLHGGGETAFRTGPADELMTRYGISVRLMEWARRRIGAGEETAHLTVKRMEGQLRVVFTRAPRAGGWHLLRLAERPAVLSARPLESLGLARREAETLFWLARGKRNAEIGVICGMRPTTVSTHLRAVFAKLGVETRTAAAAVAWETLSEAARDGHHD